MTTPRKHLQDDGFGLIELLIAMTVMMVGLMAVVAGFSASALSLQRAGRIATAGTIADAQMERYHAIRWSSIALDSARIPLAPSGYFTDKACALACLADRQVTSYPCDEVASPQACASRTVIGADGRPYRADVYIKWGCPVPGATINTSAPYSSSDPACVPPPPAVATSRAVKVVTIVVRDARNPASALFRETSTFDRSFG